MATHPGTAAGGGDADVDQAGQEMFEVGVAGPGTDLDLIDTELAEHERWTGSFGDLGTAGSDQRARFLLEMTGQGAVSGAAGGVVMGFAMSAIGAAVGQVAGRRLATLAVSRGLSATPVPGLGSAIGGVMAVAGLAMRDWGATGQTIGRIGTGTGYERLANDLEGLAELLDVTTAIMDVVAGVLGGIAVGMWVGAILSAGALSPLAATLSAIGIGMNIATTAVGLIVSAIIRPVVAALRALHAFESQGDPATVEQQGAALSAAAGQVTGAVAGALAAKAGGHVGQAGGTRADRGITRLQEHATGGAPPRSSTSEAGPRLHVEMPEAPAPRPEADAVPPPAPSASPGPAPAPAPAPRGDAGTSPSPDAPPTPDVVIRGDFSDSALSVHGRRNTASAQAGDIARHGHQGPRGDALISEHVIPGAQVRDATFDPKHGAPDWQRTTPSGRSDGADYNNATTIAEHAAVASHKTALDNVATADLQSRGGPRNLVDDLLLPSLDRHQQAVDTAIARGEITPEQATDPTHRALAALAEMWGAGDAGGGAQARADAAAAGTRVTNPRSARGRRAASEQRRGARLSGEDVAGFDDIDWDATFSGGTRAEADAPAPASPAPGPAGRAPGGAPASGPPVPDHTQTAATTSRADAMAQYQAQVQADPARESGVWRDGAGTYHVMQGGPGSVAPPAGASGRLELVYHSHPVETDQVMRDLVTQPSQAGGDLSVLQYQHGEGPVGQRQTSELHFPVYDSTGAHVGYGSTHFTYDPTHPLPLQVRTTTPTGRTTTQRYASFADFEQRAGVGASAATPAQGQAVRDAAEAQLGTDRAGAGARIEETSRALRGGPGIVGIREGRGLAREEEDDPARAPAAGPGYTARVTGLRPGEALELPVSPAYPPPPGTTAELAVLRERVAVTRSAQEELARTRYRMAAQAAGQRAEDARLGRAATVSQGLTTGAQQQTSATGRTDATNAQQQQTAGAALGTLGRTSQEGAAVATLVGSLRTFQGLAHLFGYLPGDLGADARAAGRDVTRLIAALGRVRDADAAQGELAGRREGIAANHQRIGAVAQENRRTTEELVRGEVQVAELRARNQAALGETDAVGAQAQAEHGAAVAEERETQARHDDLLARMRAWAGEHRAARDAAVATARAGLVAQGLEAEEVR
ncbi:hypothetical protein [Georgenia sp. MJ206]|uniref:hypothetical protein n=1 Tax=Georgenia wangjunii TaxID=3117730 RepID=UPI002F267C20